jgi:hypothetical protein
MKRRVMGIWRMFFIPYIIIRYNNVRPILMPATINNLHFAAKTMLDAAKFFNAASSNACAVSPLPSGASMAPQDYFL